jgi:anthranilate synthase
MSRFHKLHRISFFKRNYSALTLTLCFFLSFFNRYLLAGLPETFVAARYHSIYANRETFPACLESVAETADGVIMAVQHRTLPCSAVQFHPESILTAHDHGIRIITNAIENAKAHRANKRA